MAGKEVINMVTSKQSTLAKRALQLADAMDEVRKLVLRTVFPIKSKPHHCQCTRCGRWHQSVN